LTIQNRIIILTDLEMEDEAEITEVKIVNDEKTVKEEIFTKVVRAGKRTYFFDVKATRRDDYYLTITESKKRLGKEGKVFYEKHKIFLYKEDFDKFTEGLKDAVSFIDNDTAKNLLKSPEPVTDVESEHVEKKLTTEEFTNIEFDDLGKK
jgi:hypothetical protein